MFHSKIIQSIEFLKHILHFLCQDNIYAYINVQIYQLFRLLTKLFINAITANNCATKCGNISTLLINL